MFSEENLSPLPKEMSIEINGHSIHCNVKTTLEANENALSIEVTDITSSDQIHGAVQEAAQKAYWFLDKRWQEEQLRQRLNVKLGAETYVDVFNFGDPLDDQEQEVVMTTLARIYGLLGDKNAWRLESIQILRTQKINPKNNQPFRGKEVPDQKRLEIYPAARIASEYRQGELPCSELEGTLVHEITHVTLEEKLHAVWSEEDLGWRLSPDYLIELPGGFATSMYNARPDECPTSYASLQMDDDIAESVVAFVFAPERLELKRKQLVERVLSDQEEAVANIVELPAMLPEAPTELTVIVSEKRKEGFFKMQETQEAAKRKTPITLEDFRKLHKQDEP